MLDKNASKILKYFIKTKTCQNRFTIAQKIKFSKDKQETINLIEISIDDLLENKLIKKSGYNQDGYNYVLTSFGKTYFKNKRSDNLKMILNGIVFPLCVSFITALVTTLLTIYLSNYSTDKQQIEIQCNYSNDSQTNS